MPHPGWDSFSFDGIGTAWQISTPAPLAPAVRTRLLQAVEEYDVSYSRFRPDSRIAELARAAGTVTLPDHAERLGSVFRTLHRLSGGSMTPLVGGSLEQLGYGADYALVPAARPGRRRLGKTSSTGKAARWAAASRWCSTSEPPERGSWWTCWRRPCGRTASRITWWTAAAT